MKTERFVELRKKVADAVDKNVGELADSRRMITFNPSTVNELLDVIETLQVQVTDLQAACTRLLEERRAVDIRYNVEHFHRVFDVPLPERPTVPENDRVHLCVGHVAEEFFELLEACVVSGSLKQRLHEAGVIVHEVIECVDRGSVDLPSFADACTDLDYVVESARLEFGIDGRPILKLVQAANLAKVGGPRRADSKILKPENWVVPDVAGELRKQGWRE